MFNDISSTTTRIDEVIKQLKRIANALEMIAEKDKYDV